MTLAAWIFLTGAWGIIIGSTLYCIYKLVNSKQAFGTVLEEETSAE